ncbi:MAG: (Fe-S)-binding protein [Porticoccaceae bacterium]
MSLPTNVSLFLTCSAETLYPATGRAVVTVLEAAGFRVDFPREQTCCGQKWFNCNELAESKRVALHFLKVFEHSEAIVAPSSSCVDSVRNNYPQLFANDPQLHARFVALAGKTFEFCEFLDKAGVHELPQHPQTVRVTYHSSCRTLRGIGLRGVAEGYLTQLFGENYIELPEKETCCGFGGTFSVKLPEVSGQLLEDKLNNIISTAAEIVTSLDLSCLTHLSGGAEKRGISLRFTHLAELIAEALAGAKS